VESVLAENLGYLERFEEAAERLEASGHAEDAVAAVQVGAIVAAARHPGVHASHRMEGLLERVAAEHLAPIAARPPHSGPERVLHIATETYKVGGHSRMIWRWITRDAERVHSVVTTAQRAQPADGVGEAATASGGRFVPIDHDLPALERARLVRELVAEADLVVVHAHPHDPVPVVALAAAGHRPPVVFFNHGDHLFWLGAATADVVYSIRPAGSWLAQRRGIAAERCIEGPAPVAGADGHGRTAEPAAEERARARAATVKQFGWRADVVLLATVGASYKYDGGPGSTLLELALPVIEADPRTALIAVGPRDEGEWAAARERTGGRIVALGPRTGVGTVYTAADVYLESRPTGGAGASSEAAGHGLPVLTHAADAVEADMSNFEARYGAIATQGAGEYRAMLRRLVDEPELRAEHGVRAREAIAAADAGWQEAVEAAYRHAAELGPTSAAELAPLPAASDAYDEFIAAASSIRQAIPSPTAERLLAGLEAATRCPVVRSLFGDRLDIAGGPRSVIAAIFCAPRPDAEELRAAVAEFRLMAIAGVAARFVLAMTPEDAEVAIPVLEEALAAVPGLEVDLVLDLAPASVRPDGALELVVGDGGGPLEPHQYAVAPARATALTG
jgi:hypothetical protein